MMELAESINEPDDFDAITEKDDQLSDALIIINSHLPRLDHLANLSTIIRVIKLQVAEGERLLKITAVAAKRLSFDTAEQHAQMSAILNEMRGTLQSVVKGSLPDDIPAYVENQITNKLDSLRDISLRASSTRLSIPRSRRLLNSRISRMPLTDS